ncbi:MAG: N(5)-(carboxyethyl)ornithine synthase [Brevibacterium sp.]|uniref:N(5)-(carboxyethyl)ornithine synthase n=1 Tax=Brevibacterium sp. TaxID=1701 RepID=UPI00264722E1|nr:N(5)-(carboxyethyl)ornithine synthase [Brevibacterium sp.]MDN5806234.1 N(5)-(carboxyethyl)ornithine synthase [Brevibacterium sp.]MDN5832762.1 N(5)-(carboxyethyl)ornithine synthase [Brevibacterium sp.]MDN5875403.1 N(5)-(carboxyethyl)ornithine synthase [Brevibacterium sp.]MDN5908563.1 N(5)-(carboxyethyl)ornithine synthase [Brevibacterium sp.]MDN6133081.1 N(5)-(carboxyethyl)ornithine synthase [Brevibacterium sp.]
MSGTVQPTSAVSVTSTDDASPNSDLLTLGLLAGSSMENERRLPIHPNHIDRIDPEVRARMIVERGYAADFQLEPGYIESRVGRVAERSEVIDSADVLLLPKPQAADVEAIPEGRILWGWPHCVQDVAMAQTAIDRRLTLIAFEAMNHWTRQGDFSLHVFHQNNELAGYCSVQHALSLTGSTGDYGPRLSAVVIGFGATARGAVTALKAQGIHDIQVLTQRGVAAVGSPIHSAHITQLKTDEGPIHLSTVVTNDGDVLLPTFLASHDIVLNCTLQDVSAPMTYLRTEDLKEFSPGSLIIDVSCDEGMGFEWAKPTGFDDPMFTVGQGVNYYAVDHTPSYLWNSATWEISEALLPYLRTVLEGPDAWSQIPTISRAIEIENGEIRNPSILSFQGRESEYPYPRTVE